mmetsp:Transcript_72749/g.208863  ORF Transcript_72749/g.208863 Transcript_72749/m.208863 type:complete len:229 (-) Transcript_72749:631-1317(-)
MSPSKREGTPDGGGKSSCCSCSSAAKFARCRVRSSANCSSAVPSNERRCNSVSEIRVATRNAVSLMSSWTPGPLVSVSNTSSLYKLPLMAMSRAAPERNTDGNLVLASGNVGINAGADDVVAAMGAAAGDEAGTSSAIGTAQGPPRGDVSRGAAKGCISTLAAKLFLSASVFFDGVDSERSAGSYLTRARGLTRASPVGITVARIWPRGREPSMEASGSCDASLMMWK